MGRGMEAECCRVDRICKMILTWVGGTLCRGWGMGQWRVAQARAQTLASQTGPGQ